MSESSFVAKVDSGVGAGDGLESWCLESQEPPYSSDHKILGMPSVDIRLITELSVTNRY